MCLRSAASRYLRPTPILFMSAPARPAYAATSLMATASTNRSMAVRPGRISAFATRGRSDESSSIPRILTSSMLRLSGILSGRTPSAASSARPTAERLGRKFSIKTKTPEGSTSLLIRTTPTFCMPRYGRRGARLGDSPAVGRVAASIGRTMAEPHGSSFKSTGFPRDPMAASGFR